MMVSCTLRGARRTSSSRQAAKNIAPANIEMDLATLPLIENAIVCGERRPYLTALIRLNAASVTQFAADRGLSDKDSQLQQSIRQKLQEGIDAINDRHSRVESIRRFAILPRPFSIEDGDLTPTMKVKRSAVMKKFERIIDELYDHGTAI